MPYVKQEYREEILQRPLGQVGESLEIPGELNYAITTLCVDYLGETPRYTNINEVIGVLECAKQELYRRVAEPYEDIACATNGDVYGDQG